MLAASTSRFRAQLVSGRVGYDIAPRWDVGGLASLMWSPESGRRRALGAEVGYLLRENLWLSIGYNWTAFSDRDLVSSTYTTKGWFARLRMKFDEGLFSRDRDSHPKP